MSILNREMAERVEGCPQLAWLTGPAGDPEYCNRRSLDYFGLAGYEATSWHWLWMVYPVDLPRVRRAWRTAIETGTPFLARYRLRRADGAYRWHVGRALPLHDHGGRITGWHFTTSAVETEALTVRLIREPALV